MPENTKHAFVKALDLGAKAIEFDVQLTRDDVPVIIHDETLERTTDGKGRVAKTDFKVLGKLDAGSWFGASFAGLEIPTLKEVLATFGGRVLLNIELKPDGKRTKKLVKKVADLVEEHDLLGDVVFSSFDEKALKILRDEVPEARIGILTEPGDLDGAMALASLLGAENLHAHVAMVDTELVARCRRMGLKLWAWTANEPGEIALLAAIGVDGIFSDHPERVAKLGHKKRKTKVAKKVGKRRVRTRRAVVGRV
jgi:glycerophosphoryl diester phosphodiesterase